MKIKQWTAGLAVAGLVSFPTFGSDQEPPSAMLTLLDSTSISGYVNTSAHWNPGTRNVLVPAYSYNRINKQDGFNLNVIKLSIEKPLGHAESAAGYKVDLLFGPDANSLGTGGLDPGAVAGGGPGGPGPLGGQEGVSDFNIKQAYVALRAPLGNGLDFKVGVFDSVIGFEGFDATSNPNYTRSYGYSIEPTTHTGVLATYQFSEIVAVSAGVANTFGPLINEKAWNQTERNKAESYKTYMGSIELIAPGDFGFLKGSSLYLGVVNGWNVNSPTPSRSAATPPTYPAVQTSWYAGMMLNTPIDALRVGAAFDYAGVSKQSLPGAPTISSGYRNASSAYVSYQATEKLSFHGRGEYFTQTSARARLALPSKVIATTVTLQYDLWKNVLSRLEVRWDHQADGFGKAYGAINPAPPISGLGGTRRNAWLLAGNVIYKF